MSQSCRRTFSHFQLSLSSIAISAVFLSPPQAAGYIAARRARCAAMPPAEAADIASASRFFASFQAEIPPLRQPAASFRASIGQPAHSFRQLLLLSMPPFHWLSVSRFSSDISFFTISHFSFSLIRHIDVTDFRYEASLRCQLIFSYFSSPLSPACSPAFASSRFDTPRDSELSPKPRGFAVFERYL